MKKYNSIFYLLFVLLILGAFSSMAQNTYGMTILGIVAGSFSLMFFYRLYRIGKRKSQHSPPDSGELLCLGIMALLTTLRLFNIHFGFTEILFTAAGLALTAIYGWKMISAFQKLKSKNHLLSLLIPAYYLSICFFMISLISFSVFPQVSFILTALAFLLLIIFLIVSLAAKEQMIDADRFPVFTWVARYKDQSIIVASLFFLFALYLGLSNQGLLPKLYTDHLPQAYYRLVRDADTRKEITVNGKYRHDDFKKNYDAFVERNIKDNR
jgi:hypothetical protein